MVTGYDNGLCQDYNRKLGRWFADRLGAREQLRKDFQMKKYLITEDQLHVLHAVAETQKMPGLINLVESLKPIEPLTDAEIHLTLRKVNATSVIAFNYRIVRGQSLTRPEQDELAFDVRICRAIEQRIIGSETP